jgi:outer membrane receptor protein involved in Fe transport
MQKHIRWCLLLMLLMALTSQVFAQATASAGIDGTVVDQSKAVVPDATVTITSIQTGATRTATTNANGSYRFDLLPVGTYSVKATKAGFATASASNVELQIGRTSTIELALKPGSATETIEVTSEVPLVDELKTDVSQNITPTEVQELPMIGRDVANLAYLAPGVKAADSYDPTKNRMAILSVNGQGGRNVNVTVNGVDNKDNTVGGPVMQLPLEAVQEFAISTQRFSAANGRSEGAAINMITKSGSNQYHGSAFGYFRDQALNKDQKQVDGTLVNPPYSRQQFGGSIGGPVAKDKLFTFFAFERLREKTSLAEDPNAFAELSLAAANGLSAKPSSVLATPFYENRYSGRLDYRLNDRNTFYLSANLQANNGNNDQSDGTGDLTNGNFTVNHMQLANVTWNSVINNSTVNQATVGFQYWNNLIASNISVPLVTFPAPASFGTNTNVPQQSYQRKWQFKDDLTKTVGKHTLKGGVDYIWNPTLGGFFEFSSTLEIDFAADPSCILAAVDNADKSCGPTAFPNKFASPGAISGMTVANGDPRTDVPGGTKQLGLYFQDDWKLTHRLTLNLGLRYDRDFNMLGSSAVANSRTFQELTAAKSFAPAFVSRLVDSQPKDDNLDFSPRIGFAYDLTGSGRHIVRGGYGLYYGNVFQNIPIFMEQQHNPTIFQTVFSVGAGDLVPGTAIPVQNWRYGVDPLPTIAPPSSQLSDGSTGRLIDPDYRNPVTEEFNAGYAWQVSKSGVIEVDYTHVLSLHENKTWNLNPTLPTTYLPTVLDGVTVNRYSFARPMSAAFAAAGVTVLGSVRDEISNGKSIYDGLSISYRQNMSRHFSVNTNYTLARANSMDGGTGSFRNYPKDPTKPNNPAWDWGPTQNDERHHFTLSGIVALPFGLQFSPIMQVGSARPYDITNGYDQLGYGTGYGRGVIVKADDAKNLTWSNGFLSTQQAAYVALGMSATNARNTARDDLRHCYFTGQCTIAQYDPLRGDMFFQLDTRLTKKIKLGEHRELELIGQAFNLTNRANYGNNFGGNIASGNFGKAQGFINPTATNLPRALYGEFGAHFRF